MAARRGSFHESSSPAVEESLFTRLIIAPVLFVSFLISLFFIDRQTVGGIFGRNPDKGAYYHSHQKKLAKHDLDEAFRTRNRVIAAMVASSAVGLALAGWVVKKVYFFLMKS